MKNKKRKNEKQDSFFKEMKEILSELGVYILLEIVWSIIWKILLFIPRMMIRLLKDI